jgi:hypothetical protein
MYRPVYDKIIGLSTLTLNIKNDRLKGLGEFYIFSVLSFFVPFLLSNQLLVGTAVNMSLIGGALYMKGRNLLPVIILPSIGVLSRGIIFGPMTFYLVYMLPFIWLGNASLIFSVKLIHLHMKKNYFAAALAGSVIKSVLLFSTALMLYLMKIIPVEFLVAMGLLQLVTALSAGILFFPINKVRKRK